MSRFDVISHITSASHIREFPRATTSGFISVPALKLAVNQYVPRGYIASPGDLSIIFCHANGFHKVALSLAPPRAFINTRHHRNFMSPSSMIFSCSSNPSASASAAYGRSMQLIKAHRVS
jgi:hypothetical protein